MNSSRVESTVLPKNPTYLTPIFENIPAVLQNFPHWVAWVTIPGTPKPRKIALNPGLGYAASTKKPKSWGTFKQAVAFCMAKVGKEHQFRLDDEDVVGVVRGVGFQLAESSPFTAIDLDKCVAHGQIAPWAWKIVQHMRSYTELSPSSTGLHIFVNAEKTNNRCRKGKIEIYRHNRFLTVTGHIITKENFNV